MGASYPEHLFSANNEGIPWEVATDAADSKKDVEKVCRQHVLSTACLSLGLLDALGAICFLLAIPLSKNMWLGIPLLLCFVLAVLGCYLADKVEPSGYGQATPKYLRNDGEGHWGTPDPNSEYTNLSVPTLMDVNKDGGNPIMFVNEPYIWENIKGMESRCEHPNHWDLSIPYIAVSVPAYLNLKDEVLQEEYRRNYDDTQVRVLTAKIVYATQQIEELEEFALSPDNVVKFGKTSSTKLLEDTKKCLDWYREYRETNLTELKNLLEYKHQEQLKIRDELGIPENTAGRWKE